MKSMPMVTSHLIDAIRSQFRIDWHGRHGINHFARVYDIGMKLCRQNGANCNVVGLFAIFHDSGRINEHTDPGHGRRGAAIAERLRAQYLPKLTDGEFLLLQQSCSLHTDALTHADLTIQTCFDSDRLDLGRVGTRPDPALLCTEAAKTRKMIDWAMKRSGHVGVGPASFNNLGYVDV